MRGPGSGAGATLIGIRFNPKGSCSSPMAWEPRSGIGHQTECRFFQYRDFWRMRLSADGQFRAESLASVRATGIGSKCSVSP